jgi:hypothetical protein
MDYHTRQAIDNLASQFGESEQFIKWLSEKMVSYDNAQEWLDYIQSNVNVNDAEGYWLDLIGLIVGQPRTVDFAIPKVLFGYIDQLATLGYGQARYREDGESPTSSSTLSDPEYRVLIKARISYNFANVTLPGITSTLSVLFVADAVVVKNTGLREVSGYIGRPLTDNERALFLATNLVPASAGVNVLISDTPI